jgi:hypothetical protein
MAVYILGLYSHFVLACFMSSLSVIHCKRLENDT